jgi:tetratricopeptide (TPR) repeat protein/WD40 repeat protein
MGGEAIDDVMHWSGTPTPRRRRAGASFFLSLTIGCITCAAALLAPSPVLAQQVPAQQAPAPQPNSPEALAKRSEELSVAGQFVEALAVAEQAAQITEKNEAASGKPAENTAAALNTVAWRALFARRYDRALEAATRAISLDPDNLAARGNRAYALMHLGRAEARAAFVEHKGETIPGAGVWEDVIAKDFAEFEKHGLGHPQMAAMKEAMAAAPKSTAPELPKAMLIRGVGLFKAAKYAEATEAFAQAAAAFKERKGEDHPDYATAVTLQRNLLQIQARHAEAEPLVRKLIAIKEKKLGPDAAPLAADLDGLATILLAMNRLADAEPLYRRALAINEKAYGAEAPQVARSLNSLALLLKKINHIDEAEKAARRALAIDEKAIGPDHTDVASDLTTLALIIQDKHELAEAETLVRRSLAISEKAYGAEDMRIVPGLNSLAQILQETNHLTEAEPVLRRSLAIAEKAYGPNHPTVGVLVNNLAQFLQTTNRSAEAEPMMLRVLEISEKSNGPDHPSTSIAVNNLAHLYQVTNRLAAAEPLYRRALAIDEKSYGPDHPQTATSLSNLAMLLQDANRYAEAEPLSRQALASREKSLGPDHPQVALSLSNLGQLLQATNRFADAEALYRRALAIREKSFGPDHPHIGLSLDNLASLFLATNRHAEAEPLYRRSLAIDEKSYGPDHTAVARDLNNLARLLTETNRYVEAEPLYRRAIAIDEKSYGPHHPSVAIGLNNMAALLQDMNRYDEAELLYRRALAIDEKSYGPEHTHVATSANNLAVLFNSTKRYAEAEPLYQRTLAINEKLLGPDHPSVALDLNNMAQNLWDLGRAADAEPLYRRALAISEKSYGPDHPQVAIVLDGLATMLDEDPIRYAEAKPLHLRAQSITEKSYGPEHPDTARYLGHMAWFQARQGDWPGALQSIRRSSTIRIANARKMRAAGGEGEKRLLSLSAEKFRDHVLIAYRAAHGDAASRDEAYAMAQRAASSEAAGALAQASARFASGNNALAALAREQQDLARKRNALDKNLLTALGKTDRTAADKARAEQARIETQLGEIASALAKEHPEYVALINPEPLTVAATQALLAPDEALIQFIDIPAHLKGQIAETGFAFVITRTEARWIELPLGSLALTDRVTALRCGLDSSAWKDTPDRCAKLLGKTATEDELPPFDLVRANVLYKDLFGQAEDIIKDKRLLIAPSGALTRLPFQALTTEAPAPATNALDAYAKARWLGVRQAITVLPSASSLRTLRMGRQGSASDPFIGFGNPLLTGDNDDRSAWERQDCKRTLAIATGLRGARRGAPISRSGRLRDGVADVETLRQVAPLPETAEELCLVARNLGAPESSVYLGQRATVSQIKALSASGALARARTVHFATHGLLSGETAQFVGDRAEPALLLTPPAEDKAGKDDDGLLKASDVTGLRLNADWVVMSACNTAAGGGEGGEALSGLARAFFYSGARSLLVSHWYVRSDAAVDITTGAFSALKADPRIGRAEALRRSLADVVAKGGENAHPAVWAPFVLVGEGGATPQGVAVATAQPTPEIAQPKLEATAGAPLGSLIRSFRFHGSGRLIAFSPDAARFAVGARNNVKIWDSSAGEDKGIAAERKSSLKINALAFSKDGRHALAAVHGDEVMVWDAATGKTVRKFDNIVGASKSYVFSRDGAALASTAEDGSEVNLWNMETGERSHSITSQAVRIFSHDALVLSDDGRYLAIEQYMISESGPRVALWDMQSEKQLHLFEGRLGDIRSLAFSRNGQSLAAVGAHGGIAIWNTGTGKPIFPAGGAAPKGTKTVAVSPDGQWLASAGGRHEIKLWNLQTGKVRHMIDGHDGAVASLTFSSDGQVLASGASGVIELWDMSALETSAPAARK